MLRETLVCISWRKHWKQPTSLQNSLEPADKVCFIRENNTNVVLGLSYLCLADSFDVYFW